jgi:D-proline reductase (dithiol) PrdB
LVARAIEAVGIPTVALSVLPSATAALPAPRNVIVRYRLGQVFGEPHRQDQQTAVVRAALDALNAITTSGGVVELPFRWRRHDYPTV